MAVKVLIVDDSASVRSVLSRELSKSDEIEVVGAAPDPFVARDKIIKLQPDVLTLDIEMPRMDGITFLRKLMAHHPLPVIIVSAYTGTGAQATMEALETGAVDVMAKPLFRSAGEEEIEAFGMGLRDKILAAAKAGRRMTKPKTRPVASTPVVAPSDLASRAVLKTVAIGASTGGTEALKDILSKIPADGPPVVIVQHMPKGFTAAFAERLDALCPMEILEARDGMEIRRGRAVIGQGDYHLLVKADMTVQVKSGPLVCRHRPSVEVMFDSVAKTLGRRAVGVILTGMGRDGAEGLLHMREAGAETIGQDEASCVVYGMPREARNMGAVSRVASLDAMAETILSLV